MSEESPPNELEAKVPELPLAVYGSIGRFLSTRQKIEVREVPGKHCPTYLHVASPSDVMNLCVAGGKAIADAVKVACLHKNKGYLRRSILSALHDDIRAWMEVNDWKSLVWSQPVTAHAKFERLTITSDDIPFFRITENRNDRTITFARYEDSARKKVSQQHCFSDMMYVNNKHIRYIGSARNIERHIRERLDDGRNITLSFLQDPYSIFSDPVLAINYNLMPVLQYMIESRYISPNDVFQEVGDPPVTGTLDYAIKIPLLYHTLFGWGLDKCCYEYLITLPNLDCGAIFLVKTIHYIAEVGWVEGIERTNILFQIINRRMGTEVLDSILGHPRAPDVNYKNTPGYTPLQVVCGVHRPSPYIYFNEGSLKELRVLLEHGADPTVKRNTGSGVLQSIIDHLYERGVWDEEDAGDNSDDDSCNDVDEQRTILRQMIWLLEEYGEGAKRSSDQPPITDYFVAKKRRRLK